MQAAEHRKANTDHEQIDALIETARDFGGRGWTPATSGNYSIRLNDGNMLITRSGANKRRLAPADLMRLDAEGKALEAARPSAETQLHVQIYRHDPGARAVLHVHSPASTVMSRRHASDGRLWLKNYELLKALRGVDTHAEGLQLPIVANDQDMARLAAAIQPWLEKPERAPAYLIAGHGIYAWGVSVAEAARHLEALDFILECERQEAR